MERLATTFALPFVVFPAGAVFAILVGWSLHQVHSYVSKDAAPFFALILVLIIMGAGFVADNMAGRRRQP
jgi:hypothetical protein